MVSVSLCVYLIGLTHLYCLLFRISHDRGDCFIQQTIDTSSVFQLTRGLLIDPSAGSLFAFVMGVEGTGDDDEWKIIAINFGSLLQRQCTESDYQLYTEHSDAPSCLMGFKVVYNITMATAVCYNERSYSYKPIKQNTCDCDYTDYEWYKPLSLSLSLSSQSCVALILTYILSMQ